MHAKKNTKKTDCTLLGGALVEDLNNERERERGPTTTTTTTSLYSIENICLSSKDHIHWC